MTLTGAAHAALRQIGRVPGVVWLIFGLCVVPELALQVAGQLGEPGWRRLAYSWGGFWPGLLDNWRPNFAAQPYVMFASYGFLHGGLSHLIVNMVTLLSFGPLLVARVGQWRLAALYGLSLVGGGIGFALLSSGPTPMVGASGALFGLIGAWLAWDYSDRRTARAGLWPVLRVALFLVALNLVLWWAMAGRLAWQTHLGGFVAGWLAGAWLDRRPGAAG